MTMTIKLTDSDQKHVIKKNAQIIPQPRPVSEDGTVVFRTGKSGAEVSHVTHNTIYLPAESIIISERQEETTLDGVKFQVID